MEGLKSKTLNPKQKNNEEQARRADKLSAVHEQLYMLTALYDGSGVFKANSSRISLLRVTIAPGRYMWLRGREPVEGFVQLEERKGPLQAYRRLRPSEEIAKAKRRAREVIVALLSVVHRKFEVQTPREVWRQILGHVNEAECEL